MRKLQRKAALVSKINEWNLFTISQSKLTIGNKRSRHFALNIVSRGVPSTNYALKGSSANIKRGE